MYRTLTLITTAAVLALAGCATTAAPSSDTATSGASTSVVVPASPAAPTAEAAGSVDATHAMTQLAAKVHAAKQTSVVTEANDGNNLIGRPHEYTSKVTFKDTRIPASELQMETALDVEYGGSIEVFATPEDAAARAKYIQAVTAALPTAAEYDYVHGDVLVRVSRFLKPSQAKDYQAAANSIG
ncbi:hypothetical protein [Streptacidiphilus sp. MAP12-16]|uniref:hypothetical protein n=1 Tax=Streptacidiphilus sp. MAP12-16 TaxID=3156300 RepID=UPI00351744BC